MRVPRLLIRPDGASLLRTQLRLMHLHRTHSSHLGQHSGRLNLIGILLEHGRELRGQLLHLVIEALCLAEADCILLAVELELHHLVRVTEAPVAGLRISPLSVSRYAVNKTRNALRSVFQRTYQGKVFFFPSWIESSIWKMETYYKLKEYDPYNTVLFVRRCGLQTLNIGVNTRLLLRHGRNCESGEDGMH